MNWPNIHHHDHIQLRSGDHTFVKVRITSHHFFFALFLMLTLLLLIQSLILVSFCVTMILLLSPMSFGASWLSNQVLHLLFYLGHLWRSHSSTLAWKIPWTEEPGRLQSMGSRRVGHDWATSLSLFTFMRWKKWQPTPVFLPGESQGQGSLMGCRYGVAQSWTRLKRLSSSSSEDPSTAMSIYKQAVL